MNYYEKHIGDYIRDTVSLTMLEDGAYGRLLDQLYQSERALPSDKKELYRLARANNPPERKAVDYVLAKFFSLTDEGYTQKRAQALIEAYWDREPAAESKRENAKIRQQRTRDRRKSLFEQLRDLGVTPEFNASMRHLEAELSRVTKQNNHAGHESVTRDDTLTQPPTTNPQSPVLKPNADDDSTDSSGASDPVAEVGSPREALLPTREQPPMNADPAVQMTVALRRQGVNVMSTNPHLLQWIADGVTLEQLTEAVAVARETKGSNVKIAPGYLVPILDKIRNPPAAASKGVTGTVPAKPAGPPKGMDPKGLNESYEAYQLRIDTELKKRKVNHDASRSHCSA